MKTAATILGIITVVLSIIAIWTVGDVGMKLACTALVTGITAAIIALIASDM